MKPFPASGEFHNNLYDSFFMTHSFWIKNLSWNDNFSAEMQKLQKINSRLEKNAEDWKLKHYNCQQQLILLTESNLKQTEKNQKLEKLCRALQVGS